MGASSPRHRQQTWRTATQLEMAADQRGLLLLLKYWNSGSYSEQILLQTRRFRTKKTMQVWKVIFRGSRLRTQCWTQWRLTQCAWRPGSATAPSPSCWTPFWQEMGETGRGQFDPWESSAGPPPSLACRPGSGTCRLEEVCRKKDRTNL